ncbi:prepilin peptidase [Novibacillus thermophilus]|nr:A24 family peptidase [Novibacillus thermophilus]
MIEPLLLLLLGFAVAYTSYTDFKYFKIYNKVLLFILGLAIMLHVLQGTWRASIETLAVSFTIFFVIYLIKMTSAGDVKLFAVLGSITADIRMMGLAFILYMTGHLLIGIVHLVKQADYKPGQILTLLIQDVRGFVSKTGSGIQPVRFPAAFLIGMSVIVAGVVQKFFMV